jgi:carboxymethylenebutenolidase
MSLLAVRHVTIWSTAQSVITVAISKSTLTKQKNLHCPIMLHFGAKDTHFPQSIVDKIRTALDSKRHVEIFVYKNADQGFNCDQRKSYDRESAMLARR